MSTPYLGDPSLVWTTDQLAAALGPMPLSRIVFDPVPGTATIDDVVRLEAEQNMLCELVDATLVRKTMGYYESILATKLASLLSQFAADQNLGVVAGEAGMLRILPDQVRIPDVSFVSWERLKSTLPARDAAPSVAPDLAVEIISPGNTREEMDRKLRDYFAAGVRLVWYVYPQTKEIHVFTALEQQTVLGEPDQLTGGEVLPGLTVDLASYFAMPAP
ncbi:MAG: Uma2 family endonuclease [Planctomycetales bacterium]|nr:Uma2 family endonuclease [Planctomycetales bacterium]